MDFFMKPTIETRSSFGIAYEMNLSNKVISKLINLEPWLNNSLGTASIPLAASMEPLTV